MTGTAKERADIARERARIAAVWVDRLVVNVAKVIWVLRAPVFVAVVAYYLLSVGQTQEAYVSIASYFLAGMPSPLFWASASMAMLGVALFLVARDLTIVADDNLSDKNTVGFTLRNLPGVLSLVPLAGTAFGLYLASQSLTGYLEYQSLVNVSPKPDFAMPFLRDMREATASTQQLLAALERGMYICFGIIALAVPLILWRANGRLELFDQLSIKTQGRKVVTVLSIVLAVLIVVCAAQSMPRVGPAIIAVIRGVGAIFVLNLFLLFLLFFLATMVSWYDRHGLPIVSLLVLLALVSAYWGWNDNHSIRLIEVTNTTDKTDNPLRANATQANLRPLSLAFLDWLERRPGLQPCVPPQSCPLQTGSTGQPSPAPPKYPIYIVAAEGGGMYAAEFSASVLARLYDRCPALKDHVFAITSVSGGSIGAGLISALLNERAPAADRRKCDLDFGDVAGPGAAKGPIEIDADKYLADDFLSPLGSAGLFPDFFQRFFPLAIPAFDRMKVFEASLEATWDAHEISKRNPLRESFRAHWRPDGETPMLIFNTTSVENGQSVVVAPFLTLSRGIDYGGEIKSIYEDLICYAGGDDAGRCLGKINQTNEDMPLSTAMGLSARFPVVAPAGWISVGSNRNRYADGGYVENSGVETALLLIRNLSFFRDYPGLVIRTETGAGREIYKRVEFRLLVLGEWSGYERTDEGLTEIMSPLRALYRARVQRSEIAINRARNASIPTQVMRIDHGIFGMPLGWQLSNQTKQVISAQLGRPGECKDNREWHGYWKQLAPSFKELSARAPDWLESIAATLGVADTPKQRLAGAKERFKRLAWLRNDNACAMKAVLDGVQGSLQAPR